MLKLKLQYFGHLMQRVDSLEKTLMLGGTGGRSFSFSISPSKEHPGLIFFIGKLQSMGSQSPWVHD